MAKSISLSALLIMGAGGFGREVAWLAEQALGLSTSLIFLVDDAGFLSPPINGITVQLLAETKPTSAARYVAAVGDPAVRKRLVDRCDTAGHKSTSLVHPRAELSRYVELGEGTIICAGAILTTNIVVGRHVQLNLSCTIGHDVEIGDFSTLCPGVHISGNVVIGKGVFIGTGATIINGTSSTPLIIGDGACIAAGACVTKAVEAGALMAGVPALRKR